MAEKHKSKHKTPKDFAKSLKAETRKDMKDYTAEDAPNMVPGGVKGVLENVPRKYATEVIDNIENMVPEIKNRLYKKIEEGEYSADHARKVFKKLQIEDTDGFLEKLERIDHGAITNSMVKPENEEKLQERLNRLSDENKERLIREYVRRKIAIMIREQGGETDNQEENPLNTTPPLDVTAQVSQPETPTPEAPETPTPEAPETPTPEAPEAPEATQKTAEAQYQNAILSYMVDQNLPVDSVIDGTLDLLLATLKMLPGKTDGRLEVSNSDLKTNIVVWMTNNGIFRKEQKSPPNAQVNQDNLA